MLIYGIIKNKPGYLLPYFCIKVFQIIISSITTLGFYRYLPNVKMWITYHEDFPFKDKMVEMDHQTLEVLIFAILLFTVIIKLNIAYMVWYCYHFMITMENFRLQLSEEMNEITENVGYKGDNYETPPKYEEISINNNENDDIEKPPNYIIVINSKNQKN
jgi:lysosomal-associated transmembrane protein